MVFVVPELVGIFAHSRRALPLLTRGLIASSDFFRDYGVWLLVVLVGTVFGIRRLLRNPCLLYTSPSPRDRTRSRMPSSA